MILRPWLGQNKPPLGVRPIPGHALRPDFAMLANEGSGDKTYDPITGAVGTLNTFAWTATSGWVAGGLQFDGSSDSISYPLATFNPTGNQMTVLGLVTPSVLQHGAILSTRHNNQTEGFNVYTLGAGSIYCSVSIGAAWKTVISPAGTLATNMRSMVAFVYDGGFLRIYKNGVLVVTPVAQAGNLDGSGGTNLAVGREAALDQYPFAGLIELVYGYKRGLSASEVASITSCPYSWFGVPDLAAMWAAQEVPAAGGRALFGGPNFWPGGVPLIRVGGDL